MQLSQTIPKPLDPLRLLWVHRFLIHQLVERELTAFEAQHATAEAQNDALLEELNRTQRERIDALERAASPFSR